MIIAAFPPLHRDPAVARRLGWAGFSLNMFLNVMTPLIMVISFSDSMQLTFAARDRLIAGQDKYTAFRERRAGGRAGLRADPRHRRHFVHRAAVLRFRPDPHLRRGRACRRPSSRCSRCCRWCRCSACCWSATRRYSRSNSRAPTPASQALRTFCDWIAVRMVSHPGLFSLIAVVVVGGLGVIYANLEPRYRLADQVPDKQQAVAASEPARRQAHRRQSDRRADRIPQGRRRSTRRRRCRPSPTFTRSSRTQAGVGNVWSLETLRRWLAEKAGRSDVATLKQYVSVIPGASGAPLHLGRAGCRGGVGPRARSRFEPDPAGGREARHGARRRCARSIPATRSRSPACRRSPRATAPT